MNISIKENFIRRHFFKTLILMAFMCLLALPAQADSFIITGFVKNKATDADLFDAKVRLLNASDSSVITETKAHLVTFYGERREDLPQFSIYNIDRNGKYILELSLDGYDNYWQEIDPATLSKRTNTMNLGNLYMKRSPKVLDELVVRPSKVYFYNKGDTLVYNADAFVLAEGSMLDDLLRQMPGVELKEGGQIYVNGRYVENLLLNGKDFFKGNNQIMLENLGAYTVKNIAVYEKQDDMDKIMGEGYGERKLSMDVRLKKEYSQGLLTNIEAGIGSSDRYLGRLFAMWYADNARVTVYGNINNLSDGGKPGQDTGFNPAWIKAGDFKNTQGGLDYWAKIPYKDISFYGDFVAAHTTVNDNKTVYTTNFLPDGDTYGYSFTNSKLKKLSLTTSHNLEIQKSKWNMKVSPSFKYYKNNDLSGLSSAVFKEEQENVNKEFIDNLYKGATADVLRSILNRNLNDDKRLGHDAYATVSSNGKIKLHNDADAFTYFIAGDYENHDYKQFQKYKLNYGDNPEYADYSDRYFDNSPNYKWKGTGALGYIFGILPGLTLDTWYQFEHTFIHEVSDLYRLENIYGTATENNPLGYLPSFSEYQSSLDPNNSFDSRKNEDNHSLHFDIDFRNSEKRFYLNVKLPVVYRRRHLHYLRGSVDENLQRNNFYLGKVTVNVNWTPKVGWLYFRFDRSVKAPDMVDMVDFTNSLDPLNVRSGNPNLKDAVSTLVQFNLQRRTWNNRLSQSYQIRFTSMDNALAYGYSYNSTNGVKTGKMYNVKGNYLAELYQSLNVYPDAAKKFKLSNTTRINYRRNVDLLGENSPEPIRRIVKNPKIEESINLSYTFGENLVEANGTMGLSRYSSSSRNFTTFTAKDFSYGVTGNFKLPMNFGISTDFTVYMRRGYSDASLNKTNYVWNARVSYSVLHGQLLFMVDGFDILHNLSNVFYNVNAQARTETYANVLPRYVMFHVQWKFHKSPKKKI